MKYLLWKIARSSNEALYVVVLKELEEYDKDAYMLIDFDSFMSLILLSYSLSIFVCFSLSHTGR